MNASDVLGASAAAVRIVVETLRELLIGTPIGGRGVAAVAWCVLVAGAGYLGVRASVARRSVR